MLTIRDKLDKLPSNSKIAIMGCGPTGVEIIGSLLDENKYNITAIDGMHRPVYMFDNKISEKIIKNWESNRVNIMMNSLVKEINQDTIYYKKDNVIESASYDMALWCGGIKNNPLTLSLLDKYFDKNKRYTGIPVNNFLALDKMNINNAYAIGDCNSTKFPKTAQVAYQQGEYLAKRFNNEFKDDNVFKFKDKGQFSYIGNYQSVHNGPYFKGGGYICHVANTFVGIFNLVKSKYL